ncbi:MAG: MBL fold metallo-hydrolase [Cyclobacteriaceae bacterium]|nr:MBL fold metallo-hydrolase [Cyclobacteriaceae bacterium]
MDVRIKFLGGAKTVTGSKYLLEIDDFRLMIDCGLFQGLKQLRLMNWEPFPVDPSGIDAVVITHAHIDHTGYLPKLVKEGFVGPVYCTEATASLMEIMLLDAAKLQEEEAEWAKKKGYSKHSSPQPLYGVEEAKQALQQLRPFHYESVVAISNDISVQFHNAGHILGSAIAEIILHGNKQTKNIVFSGDLGRKDHPILFPPAVLKSADIVLVESTYGDRENRPEKTEELLADAINEALQNDGCVLIPSFAIGRTQLLMYYLQSLIENKKIPSVPVYVDSPMAINATEVYKTHQNYHKIEKEYPNDYTFCNFPELQFYRDQEASNSLNHIKKNAIIISASGMCTGGRILHHLYYRLTKENDTLLFVGYQAEGTRGRRILEGEESVKIFGLQVPVKCNVKEITGLSAHADRNELLDWLKALEEAPKKAFVVHGEAEAAKQFSRTIKRELGWSNVIVPSYMESFELFENI